MKNSNKQKKEDKKKPKLTLKEKRLAKRQRKEDNRRPQAFLGP